MTGYRPAAGAMLAACAAALAATAPTAQERRPACDDLYDAVQAGLVSEDIDPAGDALYTSTFGTDGECRGWLYRAGVDAQALARLTPPPVVCDRLAIVLYAEAMVPEWQRDYPRLAGIARAGDPTACNEVFRDYGAEVLDGRGPACTSAALMLEAGASGSPKLLRSGAEGGDEATCKELLAKDDAPPPPTTEQLTAGPPQQGVCETIFTAVEAAVLPPDWQARADRMLALAEAGDQAACWQALDEIGATHPDGPRGPWCTRAGLAGAAEESRAGRALVAAAQAGAEAECRAAVRELAGE